MSRPRKPFGSSQPGRLPATMVKVLAAEMSDPTRHRRGKQYASDGSVLDIVIEPGVVTCEIQGSRSTPYVAAIEVRPGSGMPLRRDLHCTCTCPDDDNWDGHACKHVVAALYTLSNEFLIEPSLLDVWRGQDEADASVDDEHREFDEDPDDTPTRGRRRHLSLVRDVDDVEPAEPPASPVDDPLGVLLSIPAGAELPDVPRLDLADLPPPKDRLLAESLRDALRHVRVEWD